MAAPGSCDLIWAAESAQFGQMEATIGTATLLGGVQRLAERVGSARAKEIVFTADLYTAEQFERWNIINRVVPDDKLAEETLAFVRRLAEGPTLAHNVTKQLVREFLDAGMANADRSILEVATPLFESKDMQGGVATFLEYGPFELLERVRFNGR